MVFERRMERHENNSRIFEKRLPYTPTFDAHSRPNAAIRLSFAFLYASGEFVAFARAYQARPLIAVAPSFWSTNESARLASASAALLSPISDSTIDRRVSSTGRRSLPCRPDLTSASTIPTASLASVRAAGRLWRAWALRDRSDATVAKARWPGGRRRRSAGSTALSACSERGKSLRSR